MEKSETHRGRYKGHGKKKKDVSLSSHELFPQNVTSRTVTESNDDLDLFSVSFGHQSSQ